MSQFTVRGSYESRDGRQSFETTVEAENENVAEEHTYANIGSQHNLKRRQIEIAEVER